MVTVQDLQTAYFEVALTGPVVSCISQIRKDPNAKYSIKRCTLISTFQSPLMRLWKLLNTKSGHVTYKHKITGVVVGFQGHASSSSKDSTIDPGQAATLMEQLQKHVNMLSDEIFQFGQGGWQVGIQPAQVLASYNQRRAVQKVI